MTSKHIIKELIKRNLITVDEYGFYHCTPSSKAGSAISLFGMTTTLRRWIYLAIYGRLPNHNLRTFTTSNVIDWRLSNED